MVPRGQLFALALRWCSNLDPARNNLYQPTYFLTCGHSGYTLTVGLGYSSWTGVPTLISFFLSQGPLLWFIHGIPEKLVVVKCRKSAYGFHLTSLVLLGYSTRVYHHS